MARDYAKVAPEFWTGDTGRAIRALGSTAQVVALYLLTGPHSKAIGLFRLPLAYLSDDTGIPIEGASKALGSLTEAGFAHYDFATESVWIPEMARHQIGDVIKAKDKRREWVSKEVDKARKLPFFLAFARKYAVAYGFSYDEAEAPSKPLAMPLRGPFEALELEIEKELETEREHENVRARDSRSLLVIAFKSRWESARSAMWPGPNGDPDWDRAGRWVDETARIRGMTPEAVIARVLDHWFATPYVLKNNHPTRHFAKNFANFIDPPEPERQRGQAKATSHEEFARLAAAAEKGDPCVGI